MFPSSSRLYYGSTTSLAILFFLRFVRVTVSKTAKEEEEVKKKVESIIDLLESLLHTWVAFSVFAPTRDNLRIERSHNFPGTIGRDRISQTQVKSTRESDRIPVFSPPLSSPPATRFRDTRALSTLNPLPVLPVPSVPRSQLRRLVRASQSASQPYTSEEEERAMCDEG